MVAHKDHFALFHNTFLIINYALHISNSSKHILNPLQILKSSQHISKSSQHIHPRIPSVGRENGNGWAAPAPPPPFDVMFRSTCGESLQVLLKFCPKCGKDLAKNKEIKVRDETSGKKNVF